MTKRKSSSSARSSSPSLAPGRRKFSVTPALGTQIPAYHPPPSIEEAWRKRGAMLMQALQVALEGRGDAVDVASVERAFAAWELGNVPQKVSGRVAYLVERAYTALHEGRHPPTEQAMQGGAHVLYNGLPSAVRNNTDFAKVLLVVRRLAVEQEAWPAVVKGSSEILGWSQVALTHASHALRVAMASRIERIG